MALLREINLPPSRQNSEYIVFTGGLDTDSPPITVPAGMVRRSQNYEETINGGYTTVKGYERFSGQPSPSDAQFGVLTFTIAGSVAVGNTITGATSGATGKVIAITASTFIITKMTGTWVTESTTAGGASVVGPVIINGTAGKLGAQYKNLAADVYRSDIAAVPGSGSILGVHQYKGTKYAFRNNAGATAVDMYKSTIAGWVKIDLGFEVTYSAASGTAPIVGATITKGATSAVLKQITIESGTFAGGTAAGRLIFTTITAGPFTAGAFTGGIVATCVSQATITIPNINGVFEFDNASFTGASGSLKMYGCDGVNRGFEFDGETFLPINTGVTPDTPSHVKANQNHLFFAIGSSIFNSAIGNPYNWQSINGALEIAVSDIVTGFMDQPGSETTPALAIYCRNKTDILYGKSSATFQLVNFSSESGAIAHSIQKIGQTYVFDDRGITTLSTAQEFGNFKESTISRNITTYLATKRAQVKSSHTAKDKQQYRIFFTDGSGIYWTIGRKMSSPMPVYFPNPVFASCSAETFGGGDEEFFFGSSNGMVYQMEKGTSFDGEPIEAFFEMAFNHSKSYRMLKQYQRITFEMDGTGYSEFNFSYDLSYASSTTGQPVYELQIIDLASLNWDTPGITWDSGLTWDGISLKNLSLSITGVGENIAIKLLSSSDYFSPIKFSGVLLEYSPLRMSR